MSHELATKKTSGNLDTVETRAFQTSQAFVHGRRPGVIPLKRAFSDDSGSMRSRESRRSRDSRSGSSSAIVHRRSSGR